MVCTLNCTTQNNKNGGEIEDKYNIQTYEILWVWVLSCIHATAQYVI